MTMPRRAAIWLLAIYAVNVALRFPAVFQEFPPFQFFDESLYVRDGFLIYSTGQWVQTRFEAGGGNYYPVMLAAHLVTWVRGDTLSHEEYLILARIIGPVLIASLMPIFVTLTVARLTQDRRSVAAAAIIATLSPFALGVSRLFYPDHFIIGPVAALIWLCVGIMQGDFAKFRHYVAAGALIGFTTSIKYSGPLMFALLGPAYLVGNWKRGIVGWIADPRVWAAGAAAVAVFVLLDPILWIDPNKIVQALEFHSRHYSGWHPGLESPNSYLFYSLYGLCITFGVLGSVLFVAGCVRLWRRYRWIALVLIGFPIFFVGVLGYYPLATSRNLMPAVPFFIILMAIGAGCLLDTLERRVPDPRIVPLLVVLVLAEPVWRNTMSLINDFQRDAREAAWEWIGKNIPAGAPIAYSYVGFGMPFDKNRNPLVDAFRGDRSAMCVGYFVLDGWLYEHHGPGHNPLLWPVVSEQFYINPGQLYDNPKQEWYRARQKREDDFIALYRVIQTFSERDYYGPTITVYQRSDPCPKAP